MNFLSNLKNLPNNRVDEQYLSSYNSKLINDVDISEKVFSNKELEGGNVVNRSSEVEGKFNDIMNDSEINLSSRDIRGEVEDSLGSAQKKINNKSDGFHVGNQILEKVHLKNKFDFDGNK